MCKEKTFTGIPKLLYQLGITPNYMGYHQLLRSVELALENPKRLQCVQKEIYAEIAEQYHVDWKTVERNIRTVIHIAWNKHAVELMQIAPFSIEKKPSNIEFLAILIVQTNELSAFL